MFYRAPNLTENAIFMFISETQQTLETRICYKINKNYLKFFMHFQFQLELHCNLRFSL